MAAAAAAFISVAALVFVSQSPAPDVRLYVALIIAGTATTLLALTRARRLNARAIFAISALLHVVALFGATAFEDDYFRFIWDGWRTFAAGTPYGVAPESFFADPNVPPDLIPVLSGVNYPEYATIYGPVFEIIFAFAFKLGGADPLVLRIIFAAANLALVDVLLYRAEPRQVALYAWSPFVLAEIVLHIHPDGIMALFLVVALMFAVARPAWAGAMLGLAAGAKVTALIVWPMLLRMHPRAALAAVATLAAVYLPFLIEGHGAGFETTAMFARTWTFNPLLLVPVSSLWPGEGARMLCAGIGVACALFLHWRAKSVAETPLALIFGVVLVASAVVNAWYLLWILPFAVGTRWLWPYAASLALPLSYLTGLNLNDRALQDYQVHPLAWIAECVILIAAIAYDLRRASRAIT